MVESELKGESIVLVTTAKDIDKTHLLNYIKEQQMSHSIYLLK